MLSNRETGYFIEYVNMVIRVVNDFISSNTNRVIANNNGCRNDIERIMRCLYAYARPAAEESVNSHFPTSKQKFTPFPPAAAICSGAYFCDMLTGLNRILTSMKSRRRKNSLHDNVYATFSFLTGQRENYLGIATVNAGTNELSRRSAMLNIFHLPNELLAQIGLFSGIRGLGRLAQVCRRWRTVADDNQVWRVIASSRENICSVELENHMKEHGSFKLFVAYQACFIVSLSTNPADAITMLNAGLLQNIVVSNVFETRQKASMHTLSMSNYGMTAVIIEVGLRREKCLKLLEEKNFGALAPCLRKMSFSSMKASNTAERVSVIFESGRYAASPESSAANAASTVVKMK